MADNFTVLDGAGLSRTLNTAESGGVHTPRHDIHALPGTVESDIGFLKTFLNTLQGIVTTGRAAVNVDSVTTGKLDAIITALAGVATLATTVSSGRLLVTLSATVEGYIDGLEGYLSTLAGAIASGRMAVDLTTAVTGYLSTLAGAVAAGRLAVDLATTPTANLATLAGAISSAVMSAAAPDVTASGTLAIVGDTIAVATQGRPYAGIGWGAGFVGATLTAEFSYDGGATWAATTFVWSTGLVAATATANVAGGRGIVLPIGATHARARVTTVTSGSCSATARASFAGQPYTPQLPAALGVAAASSSLSVALCTTDTAKLDTLHTDLAVPTVMYGGKTTVTTAGTRVVLASSQAITKGVWVRALDANTGLIYVGTSSVSSTAAGTRLAPGEPIWIDIANLTTVNIDSAVNGEGVTYLGW